MSITAVITGDMVASKTLTSEERDRFIWLLSNLRDYLGSDSYTPVEIFRGDSFQLKITAPSEALKAAVIIRALFRSQYYKSDNRPWDCRLAIGIGFNEFEKNSPGMSDGEAYRLSGYGLDGMGKERLIILTPWQQINEELAVATAFADDIISNWTIKQSEISLIKLRQHLSNTEIASRQQVSRQAIDKLVNSAKLSLIEMYLNRFKQVIAHKL